ncbi:MAG: helix-turn-helix transcriptional regulator [Kiritimatiellae bacterium]|nr:helix-turn-helix transcriptional regulator [Kiritimatiellia bacterium]
MPDPTPVLTVPDILALGDGGYRTDQRPPRRELVVPADSLAVWTKGRSTYRMDEVFEVTPPFATLVPRGTVRQELRDPPIEGYFLLFHGYGLIRKTPGARAVGTVTLGDQQMQAPYLKEISAALANRLRDILLKIGNLSDADVLGKLQRTTLLFEAVGLYCEARTRAQDRHAHRDVVRLRGLIEKHACRDMPMEEIYAQIRLSHSHAQMLFVKTFGTTSVAYRNRLRLERARELLLSTQMKVREVSETVGFADPAYFSRAFRAAFGVSPSRFIYQSGDRTEA